MTAPDITALILAAGQSRRMGERHKLLELVKNKPVIRHTVENILRSHVSHVIVVTGQEAGQVKSTLKDLPVSFVHNVSYAFGLASSLVCGMSALKPSADGVLICLGDMPLVTARAINRLVSAFDSAESTAICVPTYKDVQGNPVLWTKSFFPRLLNLSGNKGAKQLLGKFEKSVLLIEMPDEPGILFDIDTPADLIQFRENFSCSS